LFGWLGDRIGRVRAMTLSVLTYALFTGLCGLAGEAWQVGALRFIAALGMGGEWSLGVALVMEVWPNRSRAFMAGLIGAAANVGYLMVGVIGLGLAAVLTNLGGGLQSIGLPESWVTWLVANQGWRIMMMLGTVPALLTFFIRLFVPESKRWKEEQASGATSHWATRDLLAVLVGACGPALIVYLWAFEHGMPLRIAGTIGGLAVATMGYIFPVIRYLQRLGQSSTSVNAQPWQPTIRRMLLAACLSGIALLGTWGSTQQAPAWAHKLTEASTKAGVVHNAKEHVLIWLSVGAIVGTIAAAFLGDLVGRRMAYFLLCLASLGSVYMLFLGNTEYGPKLLASAFVAGVCTASFYGWLPLYLPELFRTNVRATGQGFGFNFGRILAAIGVLQLGSLVGLFGQGLTLGPFTLPPGYPSACSVLSLVYLIGMILIWFAPETRGQPLPD
jgi:SHS family sialic acid transporter-like MFS transporter